MSKSAASQPPRPETPALARAPLPPPVEEPAVEGWRVRLQRFAILIGGVLATHFILFAPSLLGLKVLLPLDCLAFQSCYFPKTPEYAHIQPQNPALLDQVFQFEFQRRFAAGELRAGRLPLWDPYHYCGAPFVVPFWTPFNIPYYLLPGYLVLPWIHIIVALVAAGGTYLFFRRIVGVGFWAAVITAWCYPLTAFFQLWLGYYLSYTAAFLPWVLLAVEYTIRRPLGWGGPALALTTGLLLISGAFDLAGQVLLASGLYAVWRLGQIYFAGFQSQKLMVPAITLAAAWILGFLLAAPYWMPLTEYAATGLRMQRRASNASERPPVGITALPQMFLPGIYGTMAVGWPWFSPAPNLLESAAQGYTGVLAMLVLMPLGLATRRPLAFKIFWLSLAVFAAAWVLSLWPLTPILRLPGLNMMSHNRSLFIFCFAVLTLAAVGLDALFRGEITWQTNIRIPLICVIVFYMWCALSTFIYQADQPGANFDSLQTRFAVTAAVGGVVGGLLFFLATLAPPNWRSAFILPILLLIGFGVLSLIRAIDSRNIDTRFVVTFEDETDKTQALRIQELRELGKVNFLRCSLEGAALCALGALSWLLILKAPARVAAAAIGVVLLGELLWFAKDRNPQADVSQYYPDIGPLSRLTDRKPEGRIVGIGALPPLLAQRFGLRDVRGYDAVDPMRISNLLLRTKDPRSQAGTPIFDYATTQYWFPQLVVNSAGRIKLVPVLDSLNLRYIILRVQMGLPQQAANADETHPNRPESIIDEGEDYWVYENPNALPRAYIPKRTEVLKESQTLARLTDTEHSRTAGQFDPKEVAYLETNLDLPQNCRGSAEIVSEIPREIHVSVDMETPGLLVLADSWYAGWSATYKGENLPVHLVNAAVRGVKLPAGRGEVVFRYDPPAWVRGLRTFSIAAPLLLVWFGAAAWLSWRRRAKIATAA
jgi:hypothetical protein